MTSLLHRTAGLIAVAMACGCQNQQGLHREEEQARQTVRAPSGLRLTNSKAPAFASDRIRVTALGKGPDIIFIPGLASPGDVWTRTASALEGHFRCHLVHIRGFADAAAGANASGSVLAPVVEEIARYIAELRLQRPAIVGHSLGGSLAMMIAVRHPDAAGRLMIVDMTPFAGNYFGPPDSTAQSVRPRAEEIAKQVGGAPPGTIAPILQEMFSGMTLLDTERARILHWARTGDQRVVAQAFYEVIVADLRPDLGRIKIPVTLLFARTTDEVYLRRMYRNLPQTQLIRVDDANHFIMLDNPQRMLAEVETFMRANP